MHLLVGIISIILILVALQDSFETIVLPRRVTRGFRLARLFYRMTWTGWSGIARKIRVEKRREYFISFYGPLSLLLLLVLWAAIFIAAFGLLQWSLHSALNLPEKTVTLGSYLYMSGTTFFTLGFGDVVPISGLGRFCAVCEGGLGFAFLALIIGYAPVIYQAFSRREAEITLLDARAGSPPTALELLRRHAGDRDDLVEFLRSWERWSSEILESHLSYPVLVFYRSQHDNQSWLASLTMILDASALIMVGMNGVPQQVGRFTFAIARHAAVDIAQTFGTSPEQFLGLHVNRLLSDDFARLKEALAEAGLNMHDEATAEERLAELRSLYEPYVYALAHFLLLPLPLWMPTEESLDDWQTSVWDHFALTSQRPLGKKRRIGVASEPGKGA